MPLASARFAIYHERSNIYGHEVIALALVYIGCLPSIFCLIEPDITVQYCTSHGLFGLRFVVRAVGTTAD
jgi:hypothetical protein